MSSPWFACIGIRMPGLKPRCTSRRLRSLKKPRMCCTEVPWALKRFLCFRSRHADSSSLVTTSALPSVFYNCTGINAVPTSPLLHFALVNLLELQSRKEEARTCFENLIQKSPSPLVYIEYMRFCRRAEGVAAARKVGPSHRLERLECLKKNRPKTLKYDGHPVQVFARARKDQHSCTYQVFVAAARLEYHVNKLPKIARNIYELGETRFSRASFSPAPSRERIVWNSNCSACSLLRVD